jgi:hypothetical protein
MRQKTCRKKSSIGLTKGRMKIMKKVIVLCVTALMILGLVGCTSETETPQKEITGTLEEIMAATYSGTGIELPMLGNTVVNDENIAYFLGTTDIAYTEALASEPMISSIAHSVVLVRVAEDADIETIKKSIEQSVDGFKWICVGVEADNIKVVNVGNLIALVMDNENSQAIVDSFMELAK